MRERPRRREGQRAGAGASDRATRYRSLVNPFTPVTIFSDDQVASIHRAALGILERQGMRVLSARGRAALAAAGARVDLGVDDTGGDAVHADPLAHDLAAEAHGERLDGGFRGRVVDVLAGGAVLGGA